MDIEKLEAAAAAQGATVKSLKNSGAGKEEVEAAVAGLVAAKKALADAITAALAALPEGAPEAEALKAKLPPPPKPSNKDKKAAKDGDAAKEAARKAAEEQKLAARAKKKEAAAAKGVKEGGGKGGPADKGADGAKPDGAASKAPAAKPNGSGAAAAAPVHAKPMSNKNYELHFGAAAPPLLAVVAARLVRQEVALRRIDPKALPSGCDSVLYLPGGSRSLRGCGAIARYFARLAPPELGAYGAAGDALSASEVDEWIEWLSASGPPAAATPPLLARLARHLRMRSFVTGHAASLADAAAWLLLRQLPAPDKACSGAGVHVARWWGCVEALPAFKEAAQLLFGAAKDAGSLEIPLPNAERGKVVTRFAPEPSGHLHIGHVKAAMLSAHFATQYEGKMILRLDDTNPSKEKGDYETAIVGDLQRLDILPAKVTHTSDYFDKILKLATKMLQDGIAFIDPSPKEEQQALRLQRKPSPHRDAAVEENLRLWAEMQAGSAEGVKCCMRAKIDPASDNGALRDPTIFRCNLEPHHRTKDKYKVYPTYDLACPIVDAWEGVTHALRDRQYSDRDHQYVWFQQALQLRKVDLWGFSRINFVKTLLSKRKLQWLVDEGRADGWDDPRFPTVAGILRRGMTVQGLKAFILSMGASKNTNLMGWDKIWAFNKAVIDPSVPRYTALLADGLVPLSLEGAPPAPFAETMAAHPKDESLGKKVRFFGPTVLLQAEDAALIAEGEEVTLMSWGNAIVRKAVAENGSLKRLDGQLHLEGSVKSTKKKLTWLADTPDLVDVELVDLDFLLTKDKVEEEDDIKQVLNDHTKFVHRGRGEAAMRQLRRGDILQVERRGFYICDEPYVRPGDPIRLLFVPDGKSFFGVPPPKK
mmetsp:Transcript_27391/g.91089  ORF Transcript_27391/g.91089 Transcript_27391/m.91089 type:complete len:874 (-) Transcript_27391:1272-3893(-)